MPDKSPRRAYTIIAVFFGLCLIGSIVSFDIAFLCKSFVQFVASGRSFYKTFIFLAWATISFLVLAVFCTKATRSVSLVIIVLVTGLMLLNLYSQIAFTKQFDLGWSDYALTIVDRKISSSRFVHTHTFKPVLMVGVELVGINPLKLNADPGYAYYVLFPRGLYYAGCIGLITLCILLFFELIFLEQRWEPPLRRSFVALYVYSSFGVLRTIVDGGPLTPEFLVYSAMLFSLFKLRNEDPQESLLHCARNLVIPLFIVVPFYVITHSDQAPTFIRDYVLFSLFCLALGSTLYLMQVRTWASVSAFALSLAATLGLAGNFFWANELSYLLTEYKKGDKIYFLNYKRHETPFDVYFREGLLTVHRESAKKDGRVWDLHRRQKVPPSYAAFHIDGKTCNAKDPYPRTGRIRVIENLAPALDKPSEVLSSFVLKSCKKSEQCDYRYYAMIKGCVADTAEQIVANRLYEMGATKVIIISDQKFV